VGRLRTWQIVQGKIDIERNGGLETVE